MVFVKQLLWDRQDQVARNVIHNLLVYATGAGVQFANRASVDEILLTIKTDDGGLRRKECTTLQSIRVGAPTPGRRNG